MKIEFVARSQEKGQLDICKKIVTFEVIHGDDAILDDIDGIIALLGKPGYTID